MSKVEWGTPKLEILSTRETAAGGGTLQDVFHTANTDTNASPSGQVPGTS